ncbi:MAG TPA: calcium-binding protein [Arsenicitalea sp.]|nr:calcium-binding protein [Arsenicitalea sp.]
MPDDKLTRFPLGGLDPNGVNVEASAGVGTIANPLEWLARIVPFSHVIIGTNGNDTLSTTAEGDVVLGLGGDDQLSSAFNRTALLGGRDDDRLTTTVVIPPSPDPVDGLAVQFGGQGRDTLDATITVQGGVPPLPTVGDRTASIFLDGGDGNDVITATANVALLTTANVALRTEVLGGGGDDIINLIADARGSAGTNLAANIGHGGAGDDRITASAETNIVGFFGVATNELTGGNGNDFLDATAIARSINNVLVSNTLHGGNGDDVLHALNQTSSNVGAPISRMELWGDAGNDVLVAVGQNFGTSIIANDSSHLDGGRGDDSLSVDSSTRALFAEVHNVLDGGSGNDALTANLVAIVLGGSLPTPPPLLFNASNILNGGTGNDSLDASLSIENVSGQADASQAENRLSGGNGNDQLTAFAQLSGTAPLPGTLPAITNHLDGGAGNDILTATIAAGTAGASFLEGGAGNDRLTVFGGSGNVLNGGAGRDTLVSGIGDDTMNGEAGADTLVFAPGNGADTAAFCSGQDKIDLTAFAANNIHAFADLDIAVAGDSSIVRFDADNNVTVLETTHLAASDFLFA